MFLFLCFSINAQTVLSPGDLVIVSINGDADATYGKGFSFMPLVNLQAGTVIYFTDYGWSDLTSAFITNNSVSNSFIKYTASTAITAGTIIRNASNITNSDFIFDFTYSGVGSNNYLSLGGLTQSDQLLVFQGSRSSPTFIYAVSYVSTTLVPSGWATNVNTNGTDAAGAGSALPPGLTDDVTALSFNQPATANDNSSYSGSTTAATKAVWQNRIQTYSNWTFNDAIPIPTPPTGPFTVTDALPVELTSFSANVVGSSKVELKWQTATEVNNYGFEVERAKINTTKWKKVGFVQGHGNSNSPKDYSFNDKPLGGSEFKYRLKQIDFDGQYEYSPEVEVTLAIPADFSVKQNFPNPFNPTTKIEFSIPSDNNVEIKVFNVLGMEVATLINEYRQAGTHSIEFSAIGGASKLSSGIYFYKVISGSFSEIKKMILLR